MSTYKTISISVTDLIKVFMEENTISPVSGFFSSETIGDNDRLLDRADETIDWITVGNVTERLALYQYGMPLKEIFQDCLEKAYYFDRASSKALHLEKAKSLMDSITPDLCNRSIQNACWLLAYKDARRPESVDEINSRLNPSDASYENIRRMTSRDVAVLNFIQEKDTKAAWANYRATPYENRAKLLFQYKIGGTKSTPISGRIDVLSDSMILDFKTEHHGTGKEAGLSEQSALQVLLYYALLKRTNRKRADKITHIAIYNPRYKALYKANIAALNPVIAEAEKAVRIKAKELVTRRKNYLD